MSEIEIGTVWEPRTASDNEFADRSRRIAEAAYARVSDGPSVRVYRFAGGTVWWTADQLRREWRQDDDPEAPEEENDKYLTPATLERLRALGWDEGEDPDPTMEQIEEQIGLQDTAAGQEVMRQAADQLKEALEMTRDTEHQTYRVGDVVPLDEEEKRIVDGYKEELEAIQVAQRNLGVQYKGELSEMYELLQERRPGLKGFRLRVRQNPHEVQVLSRVSGAGEEQGV